MANQYERMRMAQFVLGRIEESRRYKVGRYNKDEIFLGQDPGIFENPMQIHVLLHNQKMSHETYLRIRKEDAGRGIATANLFYKDGVMFMVRLAERAHFKGDDRSLKRYSKDERDRMIHLRRLEKEMLERQTLSALVYFQPDTDQLQTSLRGYRIMPVELDYSHLSANDPGHGFARDRESIDYKLTEERFSLTTGSIRFRAAGGGAVLIVPERFGNF